MPPKTWFPEKHALRPRKYCIVHGAAFVSTWIEKCRHERGCECIFCFPPDTTLLDNYYVCRNSARYKPNWFYLDILISIFVGM